MNLEQQFLNNSVQTYMVIAVILLVAFIVKRFISRFVAGLIYTWVDKKNHSELRKTHVHRLIVPIEQFMIYMVSIIALYELHFPASWNIHLFKLTLQQVVESGVKFFFIILFIRNKVKSLK